MLVILHVKSEGIVVHAACRNSSGQFSKTAINTYFVNKSAAYYGDLKVIAVSTEQGNLFDPEIGI